VDSTSSRYSLLESAACGGHSRLLLPLLATRCVRLKTTETKGGPLVSVRNTNRD
jgi:hypothetical protein